MPAAVVAPPPTQVEPVTETLHGVEITDPYRWLEDQDSPRTRAWIEEQTAYTRAYLDAIPGRERIRNRIQELLAVEAVSEPRQINGRCFFLKRGPFQEQPVIMVRDGDSGQDVPLVDPARRGEGNSVTVGIFNVSDDAKLLAYSVRRGAQDAYTVEFIDVERRRVLPDQLPMGFCDGLVFSTRNDGFYYSHIGVGSACSVRRSVYWHSFGTAREQDIEIFCAGEGPHLRVYVVESPHCEYLAYLTTSLSDPPRTDLHIHDLSAEKAPTRIFEQLEGYFFPFFLDNQLICLTDWKAPNRRLVAMDLANPHCENWRELVPESRSLIQAFAIVGGLIFVSYVDNATTRIEIFDRTGQRHGCVPCPPKSTARFQVWRPESEILFYEVTSFSQPPEILSYHTPTGKSEVWSQSRVSFDPSSIDLCQVNYRSKDNTEIPMLLVCQKGHSSEPLPTFLTGYGGFGASITPQFAAYSTFLIEHGFLFVVANLRGGSELGEQWHRAGKRLNRQTAIDDFIAAAEWLLTNRRTISDKLVIGGGSNAGLLVAAALTQRPDLFRAAVCLGPMLDMLRYHKFDLASTWVEEYGSAENAEDFHCLKAYSPYHHIQDGMAFPAVMLISGDADTRCNPMHARKMAARLQAATSSPYPILLDYRPKWGHMPVQPLTIRIEALTDRLAFVCHELRVTV